MRRKYLLGDRVTVSTFTGPKDVIVVYDHGEVISITGPAEFAKAERERRKPVSIGFRKTDILHAQDDDRMLTLPCAP